MIKAILFVADGCKRLERTNPGLGFDLLCARSAGPGFGGRRLLLDLLATRVLAFVLYYASAHDPLLLTAVVLTMLLVGLVAAWIPAQRALLINPITLLREE